MKMSILCFAAAFVSAAAVAAPKGAAKGGPAGETVAEGYCAWSGLTEANYFMGRHLCPSDLRHKRVLIFYVDVEKYQDQIKTIAKSISGWNPAMYSLGDSTESMVVPRGNICLISFVGKEPPDRKEFNKFLADAGEEFSGIQWYIYMNVKGSKVPDHGGKLPFYCLLGPEPGDPLGSGAYDDAAKKKIASVLRDKKYNLEWKPYYGTVTEPQVMKGFTKTIASGKPLEPLIASCYKGISNKDPEKAKECQILYDALVQTRSDYIFEITSFARSCPTRAVYEAQIVMKQFPRTKKTLKPTIDKAMSIPDVSNLCKWFSQIKKWSDDDFQCKNAAEAKKIEAELKKMKTACDNLIQKSTVNVVQSAAAWIGNQADLLAPQMASKVPAK